MQGLAVLQRQAGSEKGTLFRTRSLIKVGKFQSAFFIFMGYALTT